MTAYKKNSKYYIHGKIKRDDGTYYNYTKKAPVSSLKDAREYEIEFIRKYQALELSKSAITFNELCDMYLEQWVNVKDSSRERKERCLNKARIEFGKSKINLITVDSLRKFIRHVEKEYSDKYSDGIYYALRNVFDYAVYENETQLSELDDQYDALRNQSEVERYKTRAAMREALANRGQLDSGYGRQENLIMDTKYGNAINSINMQEAKARQDIQNMISQLLAEKEYNRNTINNEYNEKRQNALNTLRGCNE